MTKTIRKVRVMDAANGGEIRTIDMAPSATAGGVSLGEGPDGGVSATWSKASC